MYKKAKTNSRLLVNQMLFLILMSMDFFLGSWLFLGNDGIKN